MKNHYRSKTFMSKRIHVFTSKTEGSNIRSSQDKENDFTEFQANKKYLPRNQKEGFSADQTEKFLLQTKNKLYSSTNQLRQFHRKRLTYKTTKEKIEFSILSKELNFTKQKLLNKQFVKIPCPIQRLQKSQRFQNDFLSELDQKLILLKKALSEAEINVFKEQLKKKIIEIKNKRDESSQIKVKMVRYFMNHQVISKFLEQAAKDTKKLLFRHQNINLYYKMKDEMIGLMSNQEMFQNHIKKIEKHEVDREKPLIIKTTQNKQRFIRIQSKPNSSSTEQRPILQKIQELLELSKNNIKEAFFNFKKPQLTYQIELQFNRRLENNLFKD